MHGKVHGGTHRLINLTMLVNPTANEPENESEVPPSITDHAIGLCIGEPGGESNCIPPENLVNVSAADGGGDTPADELLRIEAERSRPASDVGDLKSVRGSAVGRRL